MIQILFFAVFCLSSTCPPSGSGSTDEKSGPACHFLGNESNIIIKNSVFRHYKNSIGNGGCISITHSCEILIEEVNFEDCECNLNYEGGAIYIGNEVITFTSSKNNFTRCKGKSSALYGKSLFSHNFKIESTIFQNCLNGDLKIEDTYRGSTITINYCSFDSDVTFRNVTSSSISISNTKFDQLDEKKDGQLPSLSLVLDNLTKVYIKTSCFISSSSTKYDGCFFSTDNSIVSLEIEEICISGDDSTFEFDRNKYKNVNLFNMLNCKKCDKVIEKKLGTYEWLGIGAAIVVVIVGAAFVVYCMIKKNKLSPPNDLEAELNDSGDAYDVPPY